MRGQDCRGPEDHSSAAATPLEGFDRILMQRQAEGYHPKFELQIRIRRPKQSHGLQKLFDPSADSRRQSWFDPVNLWMIGAIMTHDAAVLKAREIASRVLAPSAAQDDKAGRFSTEAIESLGGSGLLGLLLPGDVGGSGLGPRTF